MTLYKDYLLGKLPDFYNKEEGSNNNNFMTGLGLTLDKRFDLSNQVLIDGLIDTASGDSLDRLGLLFNLIRDVDETDVSFRTKIKGFKGSIGGGSNQSISEALSAGIGLPETAITILDSTTIIPGFSINVSVNDNFLIEQLNSIRTIINNKKAAGVFFEGATLDSENDIFRINISSINSKDTIL